jgi:hypothetical protein
MRPAERLRSFYAGDKAMSNQLKIEFGKKVTCREVLERKGDHSKLPTYKYWMSRPIEKRDGIFLGLRTLSDGTTSYDYEEGTRYKPKHYIKAAVVCFSEKESPVYVPIEALRED